MPLSVTAKGLLTTMGGILIHLTLGTIYSISNMNTYIISYLHVIRGVDISASDAPWVFAAAAIGQAAVMMVGGMLDSKIGARWTALIGGSLVTLANVLTYWAVDNYLSTIFIYGLLFGLGIGIAYSPCLGAAMKWFPKYSGLISGCVVAGFGGGPLIFNIVQTSLVNPHNISPVKDPVTGGVYYPEEVCQNVPVTFLYLAAIIFAFVFIGSMCIFVPSEEELNEINSKNEALLGESIKEGLAPKDVLRTWKFWEIWLTFFMNGHVNVFISSFYKFIAQDFIPDDLFCSLIGSISSLCNGLSRPVWGILYDKFGYKVVMCIICAGMGIFTGTLLLIGPINRYLYLLWVCLLYFIIGGNFALFPAYTSKSFGTLHMTTNYGWVFTTQLFFSVVSAFFASTLIKSYGYSAVTILMSCIMVVSFTMNLLTKPWTYKQHPKFALPQVNGDAAAAAEAAAEPAVPAEEQNQTTEQH